MHADKPHRVRCSLRQTGDRNGGCVGGKNSLGTQNGAHRFENLALDIFPLGRCFDNERRVRHRGIASDGFDPAEQGISVVLRHFFFGDQLAQRL